MKRPWRKPRQDISPRPRRYEVLQDAAPEPETVPIGAWPYHPAPDGPARVHQADVGGGWHMTMTVNTGGPGIPADDRVRRARTFLELEVADYAAQGMLYRIDDAEQARERGEDLDERSVIAVTVAKAARHLMVHQAPPEEPQPWYHPQDPSGVRAAYDRALGGHPA